MKNILLVGNGFDLAHGLLTNYRDFLFIMKNWSNFSSRYKAVRSGRTVSDSEYDKYLVNVCLMDDNNIKELGTIINNNKWIKYYRECEAEIDLWIDFEREIFPVIHLFEKVFKLDCSMSSSGSERVEAHIMKSEFNPEERRVAKLWDKFFNTSASSVISINPPYCAMQYGILKKMILKDLREEFEEFIRAFELYLIEFVQKNTNISMLKQIRDMNITHVISFNYTMTERLYGINDDFSHHIHGKLRDNISCGKNNMVVGVNEEETISIDFMYFVKYFQRIQKASGVKYKEFTNMLHDNLDGSWGRESYNLHIYGHSLDKTDGDILEYIIGKNDSSGTLVMQPEKVKIYYYDDSDYAQKVINLINLYGRAVVEEYLENGYFEFEQTSAETC